MQICHRKIFSSVLQEKEVGVSRHLPYAYLEAEDMLCTKNGDYLVILKIEGIAQETREDSELNFEQNIRAALFASLSDPRFAIYHTIIRSKATATPFHPPSIPVIQQLNDAYQNTLARTPLFTNELYLTILYKGSGSKGNRITSRVHQWLTQVSHGLNQKQAHESRREAMKMLNEVCLRFISTLEKYRVRKLGLIQTDKGFFSEQLQFLGRILNWEENRFLAIDADISKYLPKRRLFFGQRGIESIGNRHADAEYATLLSLKEYPSHTYPGMLDYLLHLPIEMVVTQSFALQHRQETRESLELQLRRLQQSKDPDQKGVAQLQTALGGVVSGEFGFGHHHLTVMVRGEDLTQLEHNIAEVDIRLSECGIVAVRERLNLEAAFWAQFPGNFRYIVRKMPITSQNFASLCSFNNDPVGQKHGNHWGDAVTLLKTPSNLPYYFNFHKPNSDVGHSLILGMTGSGKTLLVCFLLSMCIKYQTRIFYFDKDHGAQAFMRSIGAVDENNCLGFNPLQLADTRRNRRFLFEWFISLLTAFGDSLSPEDLEMIHEAVNLNYENLKPEQRSLSNLAPAFGRKGPGTLRSRIDQWHNDGNLAEFFGASEDCLHLNSPYHCFEMGYLFEKAHQAALPSVLLYLFHRIYLQLHESHGPTIICLDEAWALLDNPIFARSIKIWLKTFRKMNAIVILLTQEITDISKASISETLNAETVTKIFFPDPAPVKEIYRDIFQLTEREIALLKQYSHGKRYFLIKQPQESTFAQLDLNGMEFWIPLLSGNRHTVQLLQRLLKEHSENWLPLYLDQANVKSI